MKLLITPAQVAQTAFRAPDFITPEAIPEATILAAQQKFIRPVLGDLCDRMCDGAYADFLREYIAQPLALYVKMLMLPSLAVQAGAGGVVETVPANSAKASDAKLRSAVRRLRGDAAALMRRAVEHIEGAPEAFPEYDANENILKRCSLDGQIVL